MINYGNGVHWHSTWFKRIRPWVQSSSYQKVTIVLWQRYNFKNNILQYTKSHWILHFKVVNYIRIAFQYNFISNILDYVTYSIHAITTLFKRHFSETYSWGKFVFNCSVVWLKITYHLKVPLFFLYKKKKSYNKYPYTFSPCFHQCDSFLG